jgi:hypothetical protein
VQTRSRLLILLRSNAQRRCCSTNVARLRDAEPIVDVQAIGDRVAARGDELELFSIAEQRRELGCRSVA